MADPYFDNVTLLLPLIGANGSQIITDYSSRGQSVYVPGASSAAIDTSRSAHYGVNGSFSNPSSSTALEVRHPGAFSYGSHDFTVEAWIYAITGSAGSNIFTTDSGSLFLWDGKLNYYRDIVDIYEDTALALDTWHHVAVTRASGTVRLFRNGAVIGSASDASLGADDWLQSDLVGHMNDLRITIGTARYTAAFTPPGALMRQISGTVTGGDGLPAERTVMALPRVANNQAAFSTQSDATDGSYSLWVPDAEMSRVVLADEATLTNDLVDRVIPG